MLCLYSNHNISFKDEIIQEPNNLIEYMILQVDPKTSTICWQYDAECCP